MQENLSAVGLQPQPEPTRGAYNAPHTSNWWRSSLLLSTPPPLSAF